MMFNSKIRKANKYQARIDTLDKWIESEKKRIISYRTLQKKYKMMLLEVKNQMTNAEVIEFHMRARK